MKKEEFLKKKEELKMKLKNVVVEVDKSLPAEYAMGCCYDEKEHTWKVYEKILPDRSNEYDYYYNLVTQSEEAAFDKLYEMMMKWIRYEEKEEEQQKKRLADEEKGLTAEEVQELREQRAVAAKLSNIKQVFFCNSYFTERIGENRELEYIVRNNMYCQIKYIKEKRAFVILCADNKEDAIKGNLKIGTEYYYMDEPEKEMLHRLDEDVMTNYMK